MVVKPEALRLSRHGCWKIISLFLFFSENDKSIVCVNYSRGEETEEDFIEGDSGVVARVPVF